MQFIVSKALWPVLRKDIQDPLPSHTSRKESMFFSPLYQEFLMSVPTSRLSQEASANARFEHVNLKKSSLLTWLDIDPNSSKHSDND